MEVFTESASQGKCIIIGVGGIRVPYGPRRIEGYNGGKGCRVKGCRIQENCDLEWKFLQSQLLKVSVLL